MTHPMTKEDFPVSNIRHFLKPGPIVLVLSQWQAQTNIMTMGWHMVMMFKLTPGKSEQVGAPRVEECYASFECRLHDDAIVERYNLFIFEVVKAHVAPSADEEESLHYRGMGELTELASINRPSGAVSVTSSVENQL